MCLRHKCTGWSTLFAEMLVVNALIVVADVK